MDRSESRCRHRSDCCLRQPARRKRGVEKEGDEAGKSGPVSRGDGADQSERRKRLRAIETTGEAARCHTTECKPAGSPEEPLGFVQKQVSDKRRISDKTSLTPCRRRSDRGRQVALSRPTGERTARPVSRNFQSDWIRQLTENDSPSPIRWEYLVTVAAGVPPAVEPGILPGGFSCGLRRQFLVQSSHSGRQDAALYGSQDGCRYSRKATLNSYPARRRQHLGAPPRDPAKQIPRGSA